MRTTVDLTPADLDRLCRLIRVFAADPDYDVRPEHVREQWAELAAEDAGTDKLHFDGQAQPRADINA